jgi:hypothetical protein
VIKYCIGLFLMGCTVVGPRTVDPPMIAPLDVAAQPAPEKATKSARTKHSPSKCKESLEDKREEILRKLDCLNEGIGGA